LDRGFYSFIYDGFHAVTELAYILRSKYEHPEGCSPRFSPRGENPTFEQLPGLQYFNNIVNKCSNIVEATGKVGDVYLLHPLMLHSASNNSLRIPRFITNPPVSLKEPFRFDRENPEEYSLVERKTLRDLGKDHLNDWKITHGRQRLYPERLERQAKHKKEERERLEQLKREQVGRPNMREGILA